MTPDDSPPTRSDKLARRLQAALGDGYVVDRELGAGGFATVFLVSDLALKRKLAVKVILPDAFSSATVLERFKREAETVAQLSHPNIVPIHFIGQQDDLVYLAMAYVDGGSLDAAISSVAGKQMPIVDVRRAMSEVAGALAHAHRRGVTHRDVKPQNVLVDSDSGRCLVTDFGIARTADSTSLTTTGMILGTPAYLAPEQVMGEPSDHRTDIFSLGVMAYEMVTGKLPFDAPTAAATMMRRLGPPPEPVGRRRAGVPRDLQDVISGCLATDPAERFQQAGEIVSALGGDASTGRRGASGFAFKSRRRKIGRLAIIAGGTLVIAAIGMFVVNGMLDSKKNLRLGGDLPSPRAPVDSAMALIPAGDYLIGSDSGPTASRPAHRVQLAAFGIERHEVTVGEFKRFSDSTRAPVPWTEANPEPLLPVTRVQWTEATNYCRWKHPNGGDLPSEEQWEAAARGLTGRRYPWGNELDLGAANTAAARRHGPAPAGGFPRGTTPDGVHDLIGNVWEWTRSPLQAYPGGIPMADTLQRFRVIRGGAFNTAEANATTSHRGYGRPVTSRGELGFTGFRCIMPAR